MVSGELLEILLFKPPAGAAELRVFVPLTALPRFNVDGEEATKFATEKCNSLHLSLK